ACAPVPDGVPAPGAALRRPGESMHAFVGEQEYRLVVQLVVPALELVAARDLVHAVLYGLSQGGGTDDADAQVRGVQGVARTGVEAEAGQQGGGVGPVVFDEVAAGIVQRREQGVGEGYDHVL